MPEMSASDADDIVAAYEDWVGAYADEPGRSALVRLVATMVVPSKNCEAANNDFICDVIHTYLVGWRSLVGRGKEELAIERARQVLAPVLFDQDNLD